MSDIEPSPTPPGNTGPQSKVVAWTSFVVDRRTSRVYSVANGGHTDYAGNEVDQLTLETENPFWTEVLAPTPSNQLTNCQSYYADGRPTSRHSYYGVTLDEFNDRIMLFAGAEWCTSGGFHNAISSYNIGANTYNGSGTHPNLPSGLSDTAIAVDPATGDVYIANSGEMYRWNRSANTVSNLNASGTGPGGMESMSAFDTTRNRVLILGGADDDNHLYSVSSNSYSSVSLTGASAATVGTTAKGAMIYVPAIDKYLVRTSGSGGTVHQITADGFVATSYPTTGGGSIPSTQNGPYNKFLYVPRLGGVIYVPSYSGNAWFLRIH